MEAQTQTGKKHNFILQQGFEGAQAQSCPLQYSALQFQPRIVGVAVLLGVLFQSPAIFLILSAVLWWNTLVPRHNPFDAVYNRTLGSRPGAVELAPAPPPRRFAQGMAASFNLAVGLFLLLGWTKAAYVVEGLLLAAVAALVFGGFCLGSFVYHLIRGRKDFAMHTLPWSRTAA